MKILRKCSSASFPPLALGKGLLLAAVTGLEEPLFRAVLHWQEEWFFRPGPKDTIDDLTSGRQDVVVQFSVSIFCKNIKLK